MKKMDRIRRPLLKNSSSHIKYTPISNYMDNENEVIPMVSMGSAPPNILQDSSENDSSETFSDSSKRRWPDFGALCSSFLTCCCGKKKQLSPRTVLIGHRSSFARYPPNKISNQKFNAITFLPGVLYNQFKFFLNLYFLIIACSQFVPALKVGFLYTYWAPLAFVLSITVLREAIDEIRRYFRDKEINGTRYKKLNRKGAITYIKSSDIQVSDVVVIDKDQRIPADLILLKTSEKTGTCFVRTDQLDGETDWKLKVAIHGTQALKRTSDLFNCDAKIGAEKPHNDIHRFIGSFSMVDKVNRAAIAEPLSIDNALWADTVLASGSVTAVVLHTGKHTRSVMNTSNPGTKIGLVDKEINFLTKILFSLVILLAFALIVVKGFYGQWYKFMFRFIILFSYIIPIGLRVNLDLGKIVYSWFIQRDAMIPGTVVRTSTIPEELGRVNYLLSDKTGTLTQNEMVFKRLHLGSVSFGLESTREIVDQIKTGFDDPKWKSNSVGSSSDDKNFFRKKDLKQKSRLHSNLLEAVKALALCHNVTPVYDEVEGNNPVNVKSKTYQAASPDEIALVKWAELVGLTLFYRDINFVELKSPYGVTMRYEILQLFPFTSENKRMGIIVRDLETEQIVFYLKGADMVMKPIVQYNDWLEEECGNMARDGLRTLVVARKILSQEVYNDFEHRYKQAKLTMVNRSSQVNAVVESIERDMELLCVTGVEDKLQLDVRPTLEMLGNAGVKVWMLTGDKLETATCIAKSSRLVSRAHDIFIFQQVANRDEAHLELNSFRRRAPDTALVISGSSLDICLRFYAVEFVELACQCPAVVVCRCSPTQKAKIVHLLKNHTGKQICAIGDGGNDVSMIQAAHCGIGIMGKAVFSSIFYFSSVPLYQGFLMVGYPTVFTMFPVFSLVLDQDVTPKLALRYPELYRELHKGRSLSLKTFLLWVLISTYQGGAIMYGALLLFDSEFIHAVSISFTSLILTELIMVALTIRTWHWLMLVSEAASVAIYVVTLIIFKDYFDKEFLTSIGFVWRVLVLTTVSCFPLALLMYLRKRLSPPSYSKLDED